MLFLQQHFTYFRSHVTPKCKTWTISTLLKRKLFESSLDKEQSWSSWQEKVLAKQAKFSLPFHCFFKIFYCHRTVTSCLLQGRRFLWQCIGTVSFLCVFWTCSISFVNKKRKQKLCDIIVFMITCIVLVFLCMSFHFPKLTSCLSLPPPTPHHKLHTTNYTNTC